MRLHRIEEDVCRVTADEQGVDLKFEFTDADDDSVTDFLWFNRMLRREKCPAQVNLPRAIAVGDSIRVDDGLHGFWRDSPTGALNEHNWKDFASWRLLTPVDSCQKH